MRRYGLLAGLLVLLLIVPSVVAFAVASSQETVHGARAEVLFVGGDTDVAQRAEQQLRTQQVVLASRAFLTATAEELDVDVEDLREAVTVEQLDDSEVLEVTVAAENPDMAQRAAQSIVDIYVERVGAVEGSEEEQELLGTRLTELRVRQDAVEAELVELDEARADLREAGLADPVTPQQLQLESEGRELSQQISDVQNQVTDLRLSDLQQEPSVQVLTPAYLLEEPLAPKPLRAVAAGALVGVLLAGAVLVYALRRRSVP